MVYRAIGLMSGSLLDGLDIAFAEFQEVSGKWNSEIKAAYCYSYTREWVDRLESAKSLKAVDYQVLHCDYGRLVGNVVNRFIEENNLDHQVQLICSLGHTVFHEPARQMTSQLGEGATIAAATGINTVTDLRAMDIARGGRGAPIMRIGEKLLFPQFPAFLNLGGNATITLNDQSKTASFDVCAVTRVFRLLSKSEHREGDEKPATGHGTVDEKLLSLLNDLDYYRLSYPKNLSPDFGPDVVYTLIKNRKIHSLDAIQTYAEHVALQIRNSVSMLMPELSGSKMLVSGPGAHNPVLLERISHHLQELGVEMEVPDNNTIDHKEAVIVALIGILRWREETNIMGAVTGAASDSIAGAVWIGQS